MNPELTGRNQIGLFRRAAERLVSNIIVRKDVAGIIFLGGLVRGFADRFSDVDIIVFLGKRDEDLRTQIRELGIMEGRGSGIDIDLEIHFLEDFRKWEFDETDRWDFSNVEIAYDPNGEVKDMLEAKLAVPKSFWVRRIVICAEYAKWYCCPARAGVGTVAEAWIERGDLASAHYCLNYSLELLIKVIFALNKQFLPPPKWRLFYSYKLKWLPRNYKELLKEMMNAKNSSKSDFDRRLTAARIMWSAIVPKIEDETGLTLDQVSKYYVEKILRQSSKSSNSS